MKQFLLLVFLALSTSLYAQPPGQNASNWEVVPGLTDEFNGSLNTSKWKYGHPWWIGRSPMLFGNGRNAYTQNGSLWMETTVQNQNGQENYLRGGAIYSNGRLMKQGMYIESRYRASGLNIGTGFWLMHNDWENDPQGLNRTDEIDVQEAFGGSRFRNIMHTNYHNFKPGNNPTQKDDRPQPGTHAIPNGGTVSGEHHTYGLWWVSNNLVRFYLDGNMVRELRTNYTLQDMYASLNTETYGFLGSDANGGHPRVGEVNNKRTRFSGTAFRGEYKYIRCWKPKPGGGGSGGGNNGNGTIVKIPGTLEVENYKAKSSGVRVVNAPNGKKALGYIKNNTWSEHFIEVPSGGATYAVDVYAASAGSGGTIDFTINGNKLGALNVPKTNGWNDYKKVSTGNIRINGGVKTIRLVYKGSGNFLFNVDGLVFRNGGSGNTGSSNSGALTCANAPIYNPGTTYSPGQRVINNNDRRLYERTATGWKYIAQCDQAKISSNTQDSFDVFAIKNSGNTELNIKSMQGGNVAIKVYNLSGQSIYSESFNTPAPLVTIRLDQTNLSAGFYIAKVSLNGVTKTMKFSF